MPIHFNALELVILLVIVLVLFGAGRVSRLGGELGAGIREFRKGLNGGEEPTTPPADQTTATPPATSSDVTNKPV